MEGGNLRPLNEAIEDETVLEMNAERGPGGTVEVPNDGGPALVPQRAFTGGSYQVAAYNGVGRSEWVDVDDEPRPIYMAQDSPVEPFVPNWMECVIQGLPDEGLPLDASGRQFISITGHNSVKLEFDDSQLSVVHEWLDSNLQLHTLPLADEDVIATTHDVWFRPAAGATGDITERMRPVNPPSRRGR
jgi:hypothetical protein